MNAQMTLTGTIRNQSVGAVINPAAGAQPFHICIFKSLNLALLTFPERFFFSKFHFEIKLRSLTFGLPLCVKLSKLLNKGAASFLSCFGVSGRPIS